LAELVFTIKDNAVSDFIFVQKEVVLDELNVKALRRTDEESDLIKYIVKPNLPLLGQKYGKELQMIQTHLSKMDADEILEDIRSNNSYKMELNKKIISIGRDDLLIEGKSVKGYTASGNDKMTVGLTTELSEKLIQEGIVRDLIRQVQNMRKNANFAVEDRIKIYWIIQGPIGNAVRSFESFFKNEVLAVELIDKESPGEYSASLKIGDQTVQMSIERVNF
jgi:isoleucyl-tRNA synthetase